MTLKKDALLCVSLAGVVLLMAAFSTQGRRNEPLEAAGTEELSKHNRELLQVYIDAMNATTWLSKTESAAYLERARRMARSLYEEGLLKEPIDVFRAAALLKTSDDSRELGLSHQLALKAYERGVKQSKKVLMESEDRLLLSTGRRQRYGTQATWRGLPAEGRDEPHPAIPSAIANELGLTDRAAPVDKD